MSVGESERTGAFQYGAVDLSSIYHTKCVSFGLRPTLATQQRLMQLDASQGKIFDISGIPLDATFNVLLDIMVLATGIRAVEMSHTEMKDRELDDFAHALSRCTAVRSVNLSGNPGISDTGAKLLLDLVKHCPCFTAIELEGTQVSISVRQKLNELLDFNASRLSPLSTPRSPAADPWELTTSQKVSNTADELLVAADERLVISLHRLRRTLVVGCRALESLLRVLSWESVAVSIPALFLLMSLFMSSDSPTGIMLIVGVLLIHRRFTVYESTAEQEELALSQSASLPYFRVALAQVRLLRMNLEARESEKVRQALDKATKAIEEFVSDLENNSKWRIHLVVSLIALGVGSLFVATSSLLLFVVIGLFLFVPAVQPLSLWFASQPMQRVRRHVAQLLVPELERSHVSEGRGVPPLQLSGLGPPRKSNFSTPFTFSVFLEKLVDAKATHFSGKQFVPFLHVKYNHCAWISSKAIVGCQWNEESDSFQFLPFATKLMFEVFADGPETVGCISEGTLILDETVEFDKPIAVKLRESSSRDSLLRSLLREVQLHEQHEKRKYGLTSGLPFGPGFVLEQPGSLVIRLHRPVKEESPPEFQLVVEAASPVLLRPSRERAVREGSEREECPLPLRKGSFSLPPPLPRESIIREDSQSVHSGRSQLVFSSRGRGVVQRPSESAT